jgi:3-oxoacyl-[acyl-carrier-protein] synthase II
VSPRLSITGVGLVTPLGVGVEATWSRLVRGERAIGPVTLFDTTGQRSRVAAQVDGLAAPDPGWSRSSLMAAAAAQEAMEGARVDVRAQRVGLVVGGTTGGMFETEQLLARLHAEPGCREVLVEMLSHPLTATGDRLAERLGPFARIRSLSSACSSGANALVVAAGWLLAGDVDLVVAGGSDGLCRLTLAGFNALGALDPEPCRPFDRRRQGTTLGEGAGFLVIERAEHAIERGATAIAELAGWALGSEAHHITNPAADGATVTRLIERALARAGLGASDLDYVDAHGTGTPLNDGTEAAAIARALGAHAARVPVSSSKGQIGHGLAAAGAIEAIVTALVIQRRTLVPTAGLDEPDREPALVHVPHVGREVPRVRAAASSAFGFGGMDTVLVLADPSMQDRHAPVRPAMGRPVVTAAAVFGPCGLLGTTECATLVDRRVEPATPVDPDPYLDPMRARRMDRAARLGAVAVERALQGAPGEVEEVGLVLGSAFGNVDGSAAFMHRIFEKGPRAASPAEFPNLVPSSAVGHVSIYLGLRGPVFATADLAASGESAFVQGVQLVVAGEASRIVAGAVEPKSDIVDRVLAALFTRGRGQDSVARTDVAAAIAIESEADARARGTPVVARVTQTLEWRGERTSLEDVVAPLGTAAEVVVARADARVEALVASSTWHGCPRKTCAPSVGESDGLGAVALAVAVGRLATGLATEVLVLGVAGDRGFAVVMARE